MEETLQPRLNYVKKATHHDKQATHQTVFYTAFVLLQSAGGEWVGCVAVDNTGDWVVCGGSMGPTFFHLSSSSSATKTATMELPVGAVTQTAIFVNDRVRTYGDGHTLHCYRP